MTNINTYAVSSGWTWATLAQKNPKAKKAGVLAVALKGTPVSPANEVDAADGQAAITEQQKFFFIQ